MASTTDLHDIISVLMAAASIGVSSSENASPMPTRLHQKKLALALVSHIPKSKSAGLTKHILPGLASYGQKGFKIEGISAGALSQ